MPASTLKKLAKKRTLKVGHFVVEFATPGIGYILKNAGCDFVLFDTEHSGFHNETIKSALRYFEAADLPAIVRVPSKEYNHVARALDMGAEGLMVPMVNSAAEARSILDHMKYVPQGKRGVALGVAHDHYSAGPTMEKLKAANARTTLVTQIETAEGAANVDEIASIDGVDMLWIGHFDLSCSLGIPGEFEHPKFLDAVARTAAACARHGKALGRLVPDTELGIRLYKEGFDFICYSGDVWALGAAVKAGVDRIREGCEGVEPKAAAAAAPSPRRKAKARA